MPYHHLITGLPDLKVLSVSHGCHERPQRRPQGDMARVHCQLQRTPCCPRCGGYELRLKDKKDRIIKGITIGDTPTELAVTVPKYRCCGCGRTFMQSIPGVKPYSRTSEPFKKEVFNKHIKGMSQTQLASDLQIGAASCERHVQEMFSLKYRERLNTPCPAYLGIDEHHFGKRQSFSTTLCDLKKHKIYDILPGKAEGALAQNLAQIKGKHKVKLVVMDLSPSYRALVKKHFPGALIVCDRFHVIRLVLRAFSTICQKIDPKLKWQRGLPKLLSKYAGKLTPDQKARLDAYFREQPAIKNLYLFKEDLKSFLMTRNKSKKTIKKDEIIQTFLRLISELEASGFEVMKTLAKTLRSWDTEILRMFTVPYSNGVTEGFHRKMKLIQRRAYGFQNFENYRLRVIVLCGHIEEVGL